MTLITGDQITLDGNGNVSVVPDPVRADIGFTTYRTGDDVYVLPSDAAPLVAGGRLDHQLFNVSALIESGYDNAGRDNLPLIVTHDNRLRGDTRNRLSKAGARVVRDLPSADGFAVRAKHRNLPGFWSALAGETGGLRSTSQVWLDARLQPALADSVPQVGAPDAWAAGYDGTGVTVAVLDTGIDSGHPDLAGKVVAAANFTTEADEDLSGHGTHVASTIAGTGAASGGANQGVAPGASLLSGKVCTVDDCLMSSVIDGMEWAAAQGADVVNMSLGGPDAPGVDPVEQAVADLTASTGTLFVVAAGNDGQERTVGTPASADSALAVGAVDGADQLASFSSRGPRVGDSGLKPDLTAPGVEVTAARSQHSPLAGDDHTTLSGTSMATPHVAGGAAILAQRRPSWSPALLKSALMGAADPHPSLAAFAQGAGRLQVADAVAQPVTAQPASVNLGRVAHDPAPGETVDRVVTYHNHGTTDLTLTLSLSATGPDGDPAPSGMFSLSPGSVLVPAGGEAAVTLTTDLGTPVPAGQYSGRITATGGGTEVRTPFGIERLVKLTLDVTGRTGGSPTYYNSVLLPVDGSPAILVDNRPSPVTLWVPTGTYLSHTFVLDAGPGGVETSVLATPRIDAIGPPHTLDLDARLAEQVEITVPDPAAQPWQFDIGSSLAPSEGGSARITTLARSARVYTAQLGPDPWVADYRSKISSVWYVPGPDGERNAPAVYYTGWFTENELPTGLVRTVAAGDLATVDARHRAHVAGGVGYKFAVPEPADDLFGASSNISLPADLPFHRTEFYHTGGNIRWWTVFSEQVEATGQQVVRLTSDPVSYTGGSSTVQWWNRPGYGPMLATPFNPANWASRIDDLMVARLPLFGDGDGHAGFPAAGTAQGEVTLTHGGETLYHEPDNPSERIAVEVPPEYGTYQLAATAQRSGPAELSTKASVEWTFSSGTVSGGYPLRLPLWSVQLTPPLDDTNTAPAGEAFTIPVVAQAPPSSPAAGLNQLTVEYSVDDGVSWQPATVSPAGDAYEAQLTHPDLTGFVSLRASATDWAGNEVAQEVIRAYRIG